jgi:hypothetical protein
MAQPQPPPSMQSRYTVSLNTDTDLDSRAPPLAEVEVDAPITKKLGPRSIGFGGKFSTPATDLPPTIYDRSISNSFSPVILDGQLDEVIYDTSYAELALSEANPVELDIYEEEDDYVYTHRPLTVPWLLPRADGSRGLVRRGFLGMHEAGMEGGINGNAGSNLDLPSVRPSQRPLSEEARPGLEASIALSVIIGLAAIILTAYAGLSYRRKKRVNKSSSTKENGFEDEEAFTGARENEVDEEKGLKSPASAIMEDSQTPHGRKGFRLWSPLPLFSPIQSPSRGPDVATPPAPHRRAVLCSSSPVLAPLVTSFSPAPSPSPGPSPLNRVSIPGETMQSLMDALDSPLPLELDTIHESNERTSMRSMSSLEQLHHRLSTASEADSMRRHSATSTYSTCSERSSIHSKNEDDDAISDDAHLPERSNSVSSESSSVYLETPARIQTPALGDIVTGGPRIPSSGLQIPSAPSAASIHEALDDMIGLFTQPPDIPPSQEDGEELDALAKAAEAIGKIAFAQLQSNSGRNICISPTDTSSPEPLAQPIRPHNPLIKNPLFSLGEETPEQAVDQNLTVDHTAETSINSPRPAPAPRRHTLPIALLSRRSSLPTSPKPEPSRYSELYNKDHLQRALSGIRSRQNSLPTVSESATEMGSAFVQAAYEFTASMGAERVQLEQRRMTLTTKYENAMAKRNSLDFYPEAQEQTPERIALAKFLASVADTEAEDDEDNFTPYWGSEDETHSRWLVYEENFPLPESGLPQIMVTCH